MLIGIVYWMLDCENNPAGFPTEIYLVQSGALKRENCVGLHVSQKKCVMILRGHTITVFHGLLHILFFI